MKQFFMNADAGASAGGTIPTDATTAATVGNTGAAADQAQTQNSPFAVFPDEKSFMSRVSREAKKEFSEMLKSLGLEKESDLKTVIQSHRENMEKSKTDLERAVEAAQKATHERDSALKYANDLLRKSEAKVQALNLGVKPERIDFLLKLADLTAIEVNDGVVDSLAVKSSLESIVKDFPELKAAAQYQPQAQPKGGQDFSTAAQKLDLLSVEAIKNMSTEEAERRMPEIIQFLANLRK